MADTPNLTPAPKSTCATANAGEFIHFAAQKYGTYSRYSHSYGTPPHAIRSRLPPASRSSCTLPLEVQGTVQSTQDVEWSM
ncbi:hypothetical protein NMY22_g11719 [Coprinellus aureogranulatus]|nr:hypothetical protein NMY22_g11719 [Coprinellus aureogranulatus]